MPRTTYKKRMIDKDFEDYILNNCSEVLKKVKDDNKLSLCIRDNCIDVYFEKIVILSIFKSSGTYNFSFSSGLFTLSNNAINIRKPYTYEFYKEKLQFLRRVFRRNWIFKYTVDVPKHLEIIFEEYCTKNKIKKDRIPLYKLETLIEDFNMINNNLREESGCLNNLPYLKVKLDIRLKPEKDINEVFDRNFIGNMKVFIVKYSSATARGMGEWKFQSFLYNNSPFNNYTMIDLEYIRHSQTMKD